MCQVAIIIVRVLIILLHIVNEMVAAVAGISQRIVVVIDARHLVAVIIDDVA